MSVILEGSTHDCTFKTEVAEGSGIRYTYSCLYAADTLRIESEFSPPNSQELEIVHITGFRMRSH